MSDQAEAPTNPFDENLNIFHELFEYAGALSRKKVE